MRATAAAFARLRWRLFAGAFRHGGAEQLGAVLSVVASAVVAFGGGIAVLAAGRDDEWRTFVVLICVTVVMMVLALGVVAGVSQPIDPRVVATEPLSNRDRSVGLLTAAAVGPPGIAGAVIGVALAAGMTHRPAALPVVALATLSWLASLLLVARTATNGLSLLLVRAPRVGQFIVGFGGLAFYGLFQFVPASFAGLDAGERADLATALAWTPPGQIGEAIATGQDSIVASLGHTLLGSLWLIVLWWGFVTSTERLAVAMRSGGPAVRTDRNVVARWAHRACGAGPTGTVAWRSLVTRFRTPRTAIETITGAAVGLAAALSPALFRDDPGAEAVLVGGAVQLGVLFMAGNSFGNDGPAVAYEMLAGADPAVAVAGKARSILIVAAPLAVIGPLAAAAITGAWRFLPAGLGVGIAGLLAGVGAAVVQSSLVPIAVPDTDNPFASGESGQGILAAALLVLVLVGLTIVTVPVGLALLWAADRDRAGAVVGLVVAAIALGALVYRSGVWFATRRLSGRDEAFLASVTPAR
ncbi:MAG: hypothetical protein CL424_14370 [Acidimicrobiaceae bacterium]|nr:hypothetical protein [Acidimicrobiaceae bacterium]